MGWPEMLVLPNIYAWDFLLADLVFFRKAKDTKHVSRINPVAGGICSMFAPVKRSTG